MHTLYHSLASSFRSLRPGPFWTVGLLVVGLTFVIGLPAAHGQTTYTVTNTNDSGTGSLRAALNNANDGSGTPADVIEFDIPGSPPYTIEPESALPTVTDPVEIEAATQPNYSGSPVVVIDGQNAGNGVHGLTIATSEGIMSELAIVNFDGNGLLLDGASSISILSNYFGVASDSSAAGNGDNGIKMTNGANSNFVDNNVISANSARGVFIGVGNGANGNIVVDNRIGTSPDGSSEMGNGYEGILANGVTDTRIGVGFNGAIDGNVISGNGRDGISIVGGDALIRGNAIGTTAAEDVALGNDQNGVELSSGASGATVGGTTGVAGGDAGNVISGNAENGVLITDSNTASNTVLGNHIGTNGAGDALLGNTGDGVAITSGATATVGGTASDAENMIAGNHYEIYISTSNNTVQGNFLGTNADGDDLGSSFNAIRVASGTGNLIGGATSGASNVIGYTGTNSMRISGTNNVVQGNFIGTNPAGDDLSAAGTAIRLFGSGHAVGGTGSDEGNTITKNSFGISMESGTGHTIRGNAIFDNIGLGLDFNRNGVTPNDPGDTDDGVNRLQNFPEFRSASYDAGANEVTVTYLVSSDPNASGSGASAYDLTVDFYRADGDGEEGEAYLGTDTYTASEYSTCGTAPCAVTTTFTPGGSVTEQDSLLATATDANGNTSEFAASAASLGPNVFTVDATGDGADASAGDGTCATSGGDCTLRAALEETNALPNNTAGADKIHFDIADTGPHILQPGSTLPDVTDPVVIDGSTEPDFAGDPIVVIDGANISSSNLNLESGSSGSSVLDLSFINSQNHIALFIRSDDNLVDGCWIGLAPDGTTTQSTSWGLRTFGSSNQIGDPDGRGNVIVAAATGIGLANRSAPGSVVQNNRIGETPSGTAAGNNTGIQVGTGTGDADENIVGGTGSNEGNLIAHNTQGIHITNDDVKNTIRGNRIVNNDNLGLDLAGDGQTTNDPGDTDDGPNRLQNFPEIQSASYDADANEVTVTYAVPSDPNASGSGASAYDLTIDFYRTGTAQEEGEVHLGTDIYTTSDYNTSTSGPDPKTITFTPAVSVTESDHIVATATDGNGNTSEFSAQSQQLPVELTSLETTRDGTGRVALTWKTASEQNNAGFAVQHQSSGSDGWSKISFVESTAAGGTTTESQSYRYSAEDLGVGTHRFRLKQVDLDGSTSFTDPVTVELRMDETLQLSAPSPNPVQKSATFTFAVKTETETTVSLYNVLGQQVRTLYDGPATAGEAQHLRLNTRGLSSGVYLLRIQALGQTRTQRLTVVR